MLKRPLRRRRNLQSKNLSNVVDYEQQCLYVKKEKKVRRGGRGLVRIPYIYLIKKQLFEENYVKQFIMKLRNNKVYKAPTVKVTVEDALPTQDTRVESDAPTYECDICDKVFRDCRNIIVDCENG